MKIQLEAKILSKIQWKPRTEQWTMYANLLQKKTTTTDENAITITQRHRAFMVKTNANKTQSCARATVCAKILFMDMFHYHLSSSAFIGMKFIVLLRESNQNAELRRWNRQPQKCCENRKSMVTSIGTKALKCFEQFLARWINHTWNKSHNNGP